MATRAAEQRRRSIGRSAASGSCATCCCSAACGDAGSRAWPTCCSSAALSCCSSATTLIGIEHCLADLLGREPDDPVFHKGVYFGIYELVIGHLRRRVPRRLRRCFSAGGCAATGSFARSPADVGMLVLLIAIGVTGYVVEGLRIIHAADAAARAVAGRLSVRVACCRGVGVDGRVGRRDPFRAVVDAFAVWRWVSSPLMPYTRLLHSLAGTVNLAIRDHALGMMSPVSLEEVEATGQIGVGTLADFLARQLIELDACVSCGRCEDACPAFEVGQAAVAAKRGAGPGRLDELAGRRHANVHGDTIAAETLWSCTTCGACADVCPLGISPMRMITDMRRYLIGEGALRGSPAAALQKTDRAGNPWGMSPSDRMAWAAGLDVPLASRALATSTCCTGSAARRRTIAACRNCPQLRAVAEGGGRELRRARPGGTLHRRIGPPHGRRAVVPAARRQNVETLGRRSVRRIVAHCPHCVNSLRNDYPQAGGNYEVVHHSQLLADLIEARPSVLRLEQWHSAETITYHDPCYLARAAGVVEQPRQVLVGRNQCGRSLADHRVAAKQVANVVLRRAAADGCGSTIRRRSASGRARVREIAESGAGTVAVSCPFCLIMLGDGLAAQKPDVQVRDIAEVLAEAVLGPEALSSTS